MRRPHFLKPNKRCETVQHAVWVDTETYEARQTPVRVAHYLKFGWACYQRRRTNGHWCKPEWFRFVSRDEFWRWLLRKVRAKTRLYVFAHNWGFDAPVLDVFGVLPRSGWKLRTSVIESPPVILTWAREGSLLTFLDTLNWWRVPLAELGKSLGVAKLTMPAPSASRKAWDRYGRRDVEIIHCAVRAWLEFLIRYDLGGFAPTQASQAFRTFRHRFMLHQILVDDHPQALALARAALHGGRVEAFRIGRVAGPIHHFDVNSMYPAVMLQGSYPTVHRTTARDLSLRELSAWLDAGCVVAECTLSSDVPCYPTFDTGKLMFPVGSFRSFLSTPELRFALEHGHIDKVHCASYYDKAPIFAPFVTELYQHRLEAKARGDTANTEMLKRLMNGLYGKFAQSGQVWDKHAETDDLSVQQWKEIDADTGEITSYRQFSGLVQVRRREDESTDSHPAIAAHVTAEARMLLWGYITQAGRSEVYYCDTDSLFVSVTGAGRIAGHVDGSRLGALKLEGVYPWAVFRGLKDYETPDHTVIKGVRRSAKWISDREVVQESWARLPGLLRSTGLDAPTTTMMHKKLSRIYDKGRVLPDGRVLPWTLRPDGTRDRWRRPAGPFD